MAIRSIGSSKEILNSAKYEAVPVTLLSSTGGTESKNGRTIVPAGTLLLGETESIFSDRNQKVVAVTDVAESELDGVLLNDVDITDGNATGSLVYRGTVRSDKTIGYTDAVDAKLPRIQFVAGA